MLPSPGCGLHHIMQDGETFGVLQSFPRRCTPCSKHCFLVQLPSNVTTPARLPMNARPTSHSLPRKERPVPPCAYGRTTACVLPGSLSTGRRTTLSPQLTSRPWRLPGPRRVWRAGGQRTPTNPAHMFRIAAVAFLRSLGRLCLAPASPPGRYAEQIAAFIEDQRHNRWQSEETCRSGRWKVVSFLSYLEDQGYDLGSIDAGHVDAYFQHMAHRLSRTSLRTVAMGLRAWFRYCEAQRLDEARLGRGHPCAPPLPARKPPAWADLGPSQPYG